MGRNLRQSMARQAARARERFLKSLRGAEARKTQQDFLHELIGPNAATAFGEEHQFGRIESVEDYRHSVPIRHYPDLASWIDRSAGGEPAVLTAEEPVRFWKTTGTTSQPKKIPVTPSSAARTMESFLALQGTQLHFYPFLNDRSDTTLVTHVSPKTVKQFLGPRKVPYCSTTEAPVVIRAGREEYVAPWMPGLQEVVEDDAIRLYYQLCFAAAHDLLCIACLHPSRFQTVVSSLAEHGPKLIEELRNGTVLEQKIREPLVDRADHLASVLERAGTLRPKDLWPNLRLVTSWSGSYINRYKDLIEQNYCSNFLAMPSISSEAFTTMTVDQNPICQPINLRGALFEFIPSGKTVLPDTPTLQFFELQQGQTYELVLSTLGGLYRYATCDIFQVGDYLDQVPRLEYIGRRSVSDLTGEKLAEEHVLSVVPTTLGEFGLEGVSFTVCGVQATGAESRPNYVLVLETEQAALRSGLALEIDERLKKLNSRYELKRNFGDLHPLEVRAVQPGTFEAFRSTQSRRGMPAGQLKEKVLHPAGGDVLNRLLGLKREGCSS